MMARETRQNWPALILSLALHAGFLVLVMAASYFALPIFDEASEGEPVQATLSFSADDLSRAEAFARDALAWAVPRSDPRIEAR